MAALSNPGGAGGALRDGAAEAPRIPAGVVISAVLALAPIDG